MPHLPLNIDERVDAAETRFIEPPAALCLNPGACAFAPRCDEALAIDVKPAFAETRITAGLLDVSGSRQRPLELGDAAAMARAQRLNAPAPRIIG